MLRQLDRIDKTYSEIIHKWDTHYFELPLMMAGVIFAPFIVPFVVSSIYLISILYFRSEKAMQDGASLFDKSFRYTMIYLLWVLLGLVFTVTMKKLLYRERPNPGKTTRLMELRWNEHNGAFPSGDTLQSALYVGFVLLNFPQTDVHSYSKVLYNC